MKRITITKTIEIAATPEKVWSVLFTIDSYQEWAKEFSAGSTFTGDFDADSVVQFTDASNNGVIARVVKNESPEALVLEYEGAIIQGEVVYEGPAAEAMNGGIESYILETTPVGTLLTIYSDVGEEFVQATTNAWDAALVIIKNLSEK